MKRFRFPLVAIAGFAVAYGIARFAVREKYRQERLPAHPAISEQGTANEQFWQLIRKETDLVQVTAALARIIPRLSPQEAWDTLAELSKRAGSCPSIESQAFMLLQYRSEQNPGTSPPKGDGAFPVLVFDYADPFPSSPNPTQGFTGSFGFAGWNNDTSRRTPMGAVHWALVWLERRNSADALAFITELGPAWEESATRWLCEFVGNKTFAEATPWLDHIASPAVRSLVTDALFRNRMDSDWEVGRRWAMERPAQRLRNLMNCAEASVPGDSSGKSAFLLLSLLSNENPGRPGEREKLWTVLFHSESSLFEEYIRTQLHPEDVRMMCASLGTEGRRFHQWDAVKFLTVCERSRVPGLAEKVRAELTALWLQKRSVSVWGPYEIGMMQLTGLPIFPWFMPAMPEEEQ